MTSDRLCRVRIIQPVLPQYRVPLFDALYRESGLQLQVDASPRFPGAPDSVPDPPQWADCSHPCQAFLGRRIFWQRGLRLPDDHGPGDVLVVNGNPRFVSNFPLLSSARRRGMGIVWWGHGWSSTSRAWRAWIRYRLMRLADVVLLYTDDEVRDVMGRDVRGVSFRALNNTIDLTPVRKAMSEWNAAALDDFAVREHIVGRKVLLFCGRLRLDPGTELEVALRALALLIRGDPDYLLCVIGSGPDEERLHSLSSRLGLTPYLRWIGAVYEERSLAPWFMSAACFVYPGPVGLSLIHAFGYGLPVITHGDRRRQSPEISALREGENGLTFRRGDEHDLCAKIRQICETPGRRHEMSRKATVTVQVDFSFDNMVARFSDAVRTASRISLCMGQPGA